MRSESSTGYRKKEWTCQGVEAREEKEKDAKFAAPCRRPEGPGPWLLRHHTDLPRPRRHSAPAADHLQPSAGSLGPSALLPYYLLLNKFRPDNLPFGLIAVMSQNQRSVLIGKKFGKIRVGKRLSGLKGTSPKPISWSRTCLDVVIGSSPAIRICMILCHY